MYKNHKDEKRLTGTSERRTLHWTGGGVKAAHREVGGNRREGILQMPLPLMSITNAKRKIHPACLTFKLRPLSLNEGGAGALREIKWKRKTLFYRGPTMSWNLHLLILQVHQRGH